MIASHIYCLSSPSTDKCYIGSTDDVVSKRVSHHRSVAKNNHNSCSSKIITRLSDWEYNVLEEFFYNPFEEFNMKKQLEYYYIMGGLNVVNKNIPMLMSMEKYQQQYQKKVRARKGYKEYQKNYHKTYRK